METQGNVKERPLEDGVCWEIDQPAVYRWEPLQAGAGTFLPAIWLSDPSASWKGAAKDYLESIRDRLTLEDDVRKSAADQAAHAKSAEETIHLLARFVQKNFTCTAIEFGRRGRIPNRPSTVLANRYGDCKDHAVLLRAMLEAAGIPAKLALVSVKEDVRKDMPSLDQFDHAIVFVPSLRGGAFIDCTDKNSDLARGVPVGLAGKDALILDDAEPRLATIPDYPAGSSTVSSTRRVDILDDADVSVREELQLNGPLASGLRRFLRATDTTNRKEMVQQQLAAGTPEVEVHRLDFDNLEEPGIPLVIHATYVVKGRFRRVGNQIIGQLPAVWEHMFLAPKRWNIGRRPSRSLTPLPSIAAPPWHCPRAIGQPHPAGGNP